MNAATDRMAVPATEDPGRSLVHPVFLIALTVWALNDHLWKEAYGNALTGKLSDVACLVAVPLLLGGAAELLGASGRTGRRVVVGAALLCAFVMTTINTWAFAADGYELGLGIVQWPFRSIASLLQGSGVPAFCRAELTMDPSDLWTVPCAAIPAFMMRESESPQAVSLGARSCS